jgi:hypothetical protein
VTQLACNSSNSVWFTGSRLSTADPLSASVTPASVRNDKAFPGLMNCQTLLVRLYSCRTTVRRDLLILIPPLYSMKPSSLNLFMNKFTRVRVVPIISAKVS